MSKLFSSLKRKAWGLSKWTQEKPPEPSDVFAAIGRGDYNRVLELLAADPSLIHVRNSDAATPVHIAFLLFHYELGKAILLLHPDSALDTYGSGLYEGENLLHMVITQRQYDVFEWLLDRYPFLLNHETVGSFFDPGTPSYFGSYPLLFAAATNQSQMVERMVKTQGTQKGELVNSIHAADRFGNTALHMAIIYNLLDMAKFVLHLEKENPAAVPLSQRVNDEGLIPLAMAAAMGRVELFKMLLDHNTKTFWEYGPTKCVMVPLRGLEQPLNPDAAGYGPSKIVGKGNGSGNGADAEAKGGKANKLFGKSNGHKKMAPFGQNDTVGTYSVSKRAASLMVDRVALNCMCASEHQRVTRCLPHVSEEVFEGRLQMIELPEIHHLLHLKWHKFGRKKFLIRFLLLAVVMVLWTVALFIPMPYRNNSDWLTAYPANNGCIIACEACVLAWVIGVVIVEGLRLVRSGLKKYIRAHHGVVFVIWFLQLVFCALVFVLIGLRAALLFRPQLIITAIASVVGWATVLMHCVAFESSGPYIIMIYDLLTSDIRKFAAVYMTVLVGFTCAMSLIRQPLETGSTKVVDNTVLWFLTFRDMVIMGMVGKLLIPETFVGTNAWLVSIWLILYLVIQVILLVSILIAMLSHTTEELWEKTEALFLIERNNLLRYFEGHQGKGKMTRHRLKYAEALHEEEETRDPDLYMQVVKTNDQWKQQVKTQEMPFRESMLRGAIREEEAQAWGSIVEQMRASGITVMDLPDNVTRPPLRRTNPRVAVIFTPSPTTEEASLPDPVPYDLSDDPHEELYNSEAD